jgi:L-lactate dehydrogenase complex protein LldG
MEAGTVDTFRTACADLGVKVTTTAESDLAETIAAVIDPPAVATPIHFDATLKRVEGLTVNPTRGELGAARTGVTMASMGVAESGSLVLDSTPEGSEPISLYPERHVALLPVDALVSDLGVAFDRLETELADGGDAIIATGPSATADMGDLVIGAHGPRAVHVILVEEP